MPVFVDSHCHLCDRQFDKDYDDAVTRARGAGVVGLINVAYDLTSAKKALGQARSTPGVFATAGVHPHDAKAFTPEVAESLRGLLEKPEVVAVGEMGLDFFRNLSPREQQTAAFAAQLELAAETGLPAIVHDRDAHKAVLDLLTEYAARGVRGVVHCFTGDWPVATHILDLGFLLGLTGVLTYRSTTELSEVAKRVPLDRLLIETDCPYLTPQKHRKQWKRNEPSLLPAVAEFIAEVRGDPVERIAEQTMQNACDLFGISLPEVASVAATRDDSTPPRRAQARAPSLPKAKGPCVDERTWKLLEVDRVVAALSERAATEVGRERCLRLEPNPELATVRERLAETSEARALLEAGRRVPFGGIRDLRTVLRDAGIGSVLAPTDLLSVAVTLGGLRGLHHALTAPEDDAGLRLRRLAAHIVVLPALEKEIDRCLDPDGRVRDDASPKLSAVRRRIASVDRECHRKIEGLMGTSSVAKMLQEPLVTIRDDRLCVPVRAEFRSQFDGMIHDRSASGATFFIEPAAIVELNNQLRQLQLEERDEIHRILTELTGRVAERREEIGTSLRAASVLDFIFAKARLSLDWHCSLPQLSAQPRCDLVQARHPLLGEGAVPIDVALGDDFTVLLITGPNTGGKTVALKTVGLLTVMVACGLHLPAHANSTVHLFTRLFADIGDEQSLQQSLSTFSAHLKNIVRFVRHADGDTLVLLDEVGVGTDPDEGAALARAILRRLKHNGARVLATTHYSDLKNFAFAERGVENACVEFNPETLKPTYRLLTGIAGSSNALVISQRLGLPRDVVREALESMAEQKEATAELIRKMEARQRELDHAATAAERQHAEAERLRVERERQLEEAQRHSEDTREEAVAAASELLTHTRAEAEQILRQLRQQSREGKPTQQAMDRLKVIEQELAEEEEREPVLDLRQFQPGRRVRIPRLRKAGVLLTAPNDNGKVSVRTDTVTVETLAGELQLLPDEEKREEPTYLTSLRLTKSRVSMELNLIGRTVEEAIPELDKYLDDAAVGGLPYVRLIHGKGTGALRKGVHAFLRDHGMVERFELADLKQGGDGATVAYLARV